MIINRGTAYIEKSETYVNTHPREDIYFFRVDERNVHFSNDEHGVLFNKDKTKLIRGVCEMGKYRIPPTVRKIGKAAFDYKGAWDAQINITDGVRIIEDNAFFLLSECPYLPQSVTMLGKTFCVGSFTVGKNVSEIAEEVSCYDDTIYVDSENKHFMIFNDALYSKDMTRLLHVFSKDRIYEVPDCVKKIDVSAFEWNRSIQKIYLPKGICYECDEKQIFRY